MSPLRGGLSIPKETTMHHSSILNIDLDGLDDDARMDRRAGMVADLIGTERREHDRTCGNPCRIRTDELRGAHTTTIRAWVDCEL